MPAPYHPDDAEAGFRIIRYDSPANPGWGWQHLELVTTFCRQDWRADVTVNMKSMPVVGDAKVEEMLAESVFLGFGVLFFYCGQLSRPAPRDCLLKTLEGLRCDVHDILG